MISAVAALLARGRAGAAATVAAWVVLLGLLSAVAPPIADVEDNRTANDPPASSESVRAQALLRAAFPDERGLPAVVVLRNDAGLDARDAATVRRISQDLTGDRRPPGVGGVVSTVTAPGAARELVSPDRTAELVLVDVVGSPSEKAFGTTVDRIRDLVGRGTPERPVRVTGPAGIVRDTVAVFGGANLVLLLATVLLVLVLLLLIYRSPLLALVPLVAVVLAMRVTEGVGALAVRAGLFDVTSQSVSIMTVLLFGVGTDYCLFVVARYREEFAADPRHAPAMARAVRRIAPAIGSSAATVVLGLLALMLATLPALRGFGPFLALSVAVMALAGLTLVPALVILLGPAAFWPRAVAAPARSATGWGWERLSAAVTGRPRAAAAVGLGVLAVLSTGLLGYRDTYDFVSGFRVDTDSAQGQRLVQRSFPLGRLAPTDVVVHAPGQDLRRARAAVDGLAGTLAAVPGVLSAGPPGFSPDGSTARLRLTYRDDPYRTAALDRTEQVRGRARAAVARTVPGGSVLVGGESARSCDLRSANRRDLAVVAPVTVLAIALVLALLLRAVVAPVYLVATIVASFAATLGLTVFALLTLGGDAGMGVRVTVYIFVFLVALGVDYNILLVSRVREEVAAHGHADGVRLALARTGGVITSAGVVLAGTFAVLMTQPIRELFQFGFAMAAGILLDTVLVRAVLVPAVIRLAGERSWWPSRPGPDARPGSWPSRPGSSTIRAAGIAAQRSDSRE